MSIRSFLKKLQTSPSAVGKSFATRPAHSGRCNICGKSAKFYYSDPALYREELFCSSCLTISRYRSISRGILKALRELRGIESDSLSSLNTDLKVPKLEVYDTQTPFYWETCAYPVPDLLSNCPWIDVQTSLYLPNEIRGASIGPNRTNQNLESLTFENASFDIVITSDVLEHVRLDKQAHREIRRVLRPGGRYIFTVPHYRHGKDNIERVTIVDPADPERDEYVMEKEYHGDTNSKDGRALSYRIYGTEIDDFLNELGFEVEYCKTDFPEFGIFKTELFFCRLPAS